MDYHQLSSPPPRRPWYRRWTRWLLLIIGLAIGTFAVAVIFQTITITRQQLPTTTTSATPDMITNDDLSWGPVDAPITIVEFGDFNCPYCRQSVPVLKQLLREFPNDIRLIYRDFPILDQTSLTYAMAAECAQDQGDAFAWAFHDFFYTFWGEVPEDLTSPAAEFGLDVQRFSQCLTSKYYLDEVRGDMFDGYQAGVTATPTFFVNGNRVAGHQSIDSWRKAIRYLLDEQKLTGQ